MKKKIKELWKALKGVIKEYHDSNKSDDEKAFENIMNDYLDIDYKTKIKEFIKKFKSKK